MQNITINTINWVNGRTRLNQTNMNNIEGNLNLIAFKVNELVDYANANPQVEANPATTTGTLTSIKIGGVGYAVDGGGMANPMNAAGDLIVGGSSGTPVRLGKGNDGQALKMASGSPTWVDDSTGGSTVDIVGTAIVISDDE